MSTRSNIAIQLKDDKVKFIYCHFDGYLEHNGAILVEHYNTREKVEELINLGHLSSLAPKTTPDPTIEHTFRNNQKDVCVAYGRDRGDASTKAKESTLNEMFENDWIEYFYIFTLDNKWIYYDYNHKGPFDVEYDLEQLLNSEEREEEIFKKKKSKHADEEM